MDEQGDAGATDERRRLVDEFLERARELGVDPVVVHRSGPDTSRGPRQPKTRLLAAAGYRVAGTLIVPQGAALTFQFRRPARGILGFRFRQTGAPGSYVHETRTRERQAETLLFLDETTLLPVAFEQTRFGAMDTAQVADACTDYLEARQAADGRAQ